MSRNINENINLLSPIKVGDYELPNRMVMAPLTRSRAGQGLAPTEINVTYYAQRASAGLIVTEATHVTPQGIGYPYTPGVGTEEQIAGWKKVTSAVHQAGGKIFLQLWHVGRISHPSMQEGGELPVAPSAIAAEGQHFVYEGMVDFVTPRALETSEIAGIVEYFHMGAENAKAAGFDGIEIHGANGYLLDQFLEDSTNQRTDEYGGSIESRAPLARSHRSGDPSVGCEQGRRSTFAQWKFQHDERFQSGADVRFRRRKTRRAWSRLLACDRTSRQGSV
jgi:N-ethylmaleimide reductase